MTIIICQPELVEGRLQLFNLKSRIFIAHKIACMKFSKYVVFVLFFQLSLLNTVSAQKQFKALLITTTKGWHHESLHYGVIAIKELGVKNFFDVVLLEDPKGFTDKYAEQFQVIIFLNTTGDILILRSKK
jgi:hypothetical protein